MKTLYGNIGFDEINMLSGGYKEIYDILISIDKHFKSYNPTKPSFTLLNIEKQIDKLNMVFDKAYAGVEYVKAVEENPEFDARIIIDNIDRLQSEAKALKDYIQSHKKRASGIVYNAMERMDYLVRHSNFLLEQYVNVLNTISAYQMVKGSGFRIDYDSMQSTPIDMNIKYLNVLSTTEEYNTVQSTKELFDRFYQEGFVDRFPENTAFVVAVKGSPYTYIISRVEGMTDGVSARVVHPNLTHSISYRFYKDDKNKTCYMGAKTYSRDNKWGSLILHQFIDKNSFELNQALDKINDVLLTLEKDGKDLNADLSRYFTGNIVLTNKEKIYEQGLETC